MVMKHSLEFSIPWLQNYHDRTEEDKENELWIENALARLRREEDNGKFRGYLPMNGNLSFLEEFG